MVATGTQTNFTDSDLSDGTYYYSIFAYDTIGNISIGATASTTVNTYVAPPTHTVRSGIGSSDSSNTTSANGNISNNFPTSSTIVTPTTTPTNITNDEIKSSVPTTATPTTTTIIFPITTKPVFTRTLRQGIRGDDVKALQIFLNTHGFLVAKNGAGSLGNETNFYGSATAKAVKQFQENNKTDILKPYNLEKGTGIFGPTTMRFVNQILLK